MIRKITSVLSLVLAFAGMIVSMISGSVSAIIIAIIALLVLSVPSILTFTTSKEIAFIIKHVCLVVVIALVPVIYFIFPMELANYVLGDIGIALFGSSCLVTLISTLLDNPHLEIKKSYHIFSIILFSLASVVVLGFLVGSSIYFFNRKMEWFELGAILSFLIGVLLTYCSVFLRRIEYLPAFFAHLTFLLIQFFIFLGLGLKDINNIAQHAFSYNYMIISYPFLVLSAIYLPLLWNKTSTEKNINQ